MKQTVDQGVATSEVETWEDVISFTEKFAQFRSFIFRGQADSEWNLSSTLERFISSIKIVHNHSSAYSSQLANFKYSLRGRGVSTQGMNENELWCLGQHYGLFTPLLDWSYSYYIALYFAFYDKHIPEKGFRSIYALKYDYELLGGMDIYNKDKNEYDRFELILSNSDVNPRVVNQAGLFTKIPFNFDLEDWVKGYLNNMQENGPVYLYKINISDNLRLRVLRELNLMNINPSTVFPDLNGAALNCNHILDLKIDKFLEMGKQNKSNR